MENRLILCIVLSVYSCGHTDDCTLYSVQPLSSLPLVQRRTEINAMYNDDIIPVCGGTLPHQILNGNESRIQAQYNNPKEQTSSNYKKIEMLTSF